MALTFPHQYQVHTTATPEGDVLLLGERLPDLHTAAPAPFGGPGDRWSPETLVVGAVVDCFVLTFRAVARAAHLPWEALACEADGTLDRIDRVTQFTAFTIRARLRVPPGTQEEDAQRVLARTEEQCLISNSLKAARTFEAHVEISGGPGATQ